MAVPEWVTRLREATFISPSGIESTFRVDILSRVGGKKASIHEILNKDEAIPQDQGNKSTVYPIEAYFADENGDILADTFYDSLRESYSIENPGILRHPRWGDISVMPFEFQQSENLVEEGGVFRIPVTFREIPSSIFPVVGEVDQSEISAQVAEMEGVLESANEGINVDDAGDYASFGARVTNIVGIISTSLEDIANEFEDIKDEFQLIVNDIDRAITEKAEALDIMSQVNKLIRLPSQVLVITNSKINAYSDMLDDLITSYNGFFNPKAERQNQINQAVMFQNIAYFTSAVLFEASLYTEYETRDIASLALEIVNDNATLVEQSTTEIYQILTGGITDIFSPDHNTGSILSDITANTNAILIERSFDLRSKVTEILKVNSDAITLTWKYYKDMDELDFFIRTNKLTNDEYIEIPAGREVASYV